MQRLASVFIVMATACGGGSETGMASLTNVQPPVKSAASKPFVGADGGGMMMLGWKIELFADGPGADCTAGNLVGSIGIFSNQADGTKPQAILQTGDITIVTTSPPTVIGSAVATMGVDGVGEIQGLLTITEFHLTSDAMHADRIAGSINAGGVVAGSGEAVSLTGQFTAPLCEE